MNDIINTASTSQEGENKELGMKLYPKEYINITLKPWGPAVEISIDDFIAMCRANSWTHNMNNVYLTISKIPDIFSLVKKKIKALTSSNDIMYDEIKNRFKSMPVIGIDTWVSDLHIQAAGDLIVLKRIISWNYSKEIKKENKFNNLNILNNSSLIKGCLYSSIFIISSEKKLIFFTISNKIL